MSTDTQRFAAPESRFGMLASISRVLLAFGLTLLAVLTFFAAFALGYTAYHAQRVLPGVTVAGVAVGGLDRAAAETVLRAQLPSLSTGKLTVTVDGTDHVVAYSSFGRDYDVQTMLDQGTGAAGGDGSLLDQFGREMQILLNGVSIAPSVTYDSDRLIAQLGEVAQPETIAPVDATVVQQQGHFVATPSAAGMGIDLQTLVDGAAAAITNTSPADTTLAVARVTLAPAVTTEQAQAAAERAEAVVGHSLTLAAASSSTTIESDTLRGWVSIDESQPGEWPVIIDYGSIAPAVATFAETADHAPTNAGFKFTDAGIVPTAAVDGQTIDVSAATEQVFGALTARAAGSAVNTVQLATVSTPADYTTAQAAAIAGDMQRVSSWTTHMKPSIGNGFGINTRIPIEKFNGTVVYPGKKFDFKRVLGPITEEEGYVLGGALIHGRHVPQGALGGGMCAVATTMFNAALRGGLDIGERHNHGFYFKRYPLGLDATVTTTPGGLSTSWTNDTAYPILIRGIWTTTGISFQLWTVPTGREVVLTEPIVTNVKPPTYGLLEYTDDLPAGQTEVLDQASDGRDTVVTRFVYDANGALIHKEVYRSHYKPMPKTVLMGRAEGDPPDGTTVKTPVD